VLDLEASGQFLPKYRTTLVATGQAVMAEWTRAENAADSLIHARRLAQDGVGLSQFSGGQRCLNIVKSIEAPHFSFEIMLTDARGNGRSESPTAPRPPLFGLPVDLMERIRPPKTTTFPGVAGSPAVLRTAAGRRLGKRSPGDSGLQDHRTYVDLPPDFSRMRTCFRVARKTCSQEEHMEAHPIMVADLVVLKRAPAGAKKRLLSPRNGKSHAEAKVDLYASIAERPHLIESRITDADGRAFSFAPALGPFFLLAKKGKT